MTVYYAQCDFFSIKDNQYTYLQSIIKELKVKEYLINVLIYDTQAIYSLNKIPTANFVATWYIRQLSSRPSANLAVFLVFSLHLPLKALCWVHSVS